MLSGIPTHPMDWTRTKLKSATDGGPRMADAADSVEIVDEEVSMPAPHTGRSPAWSNAELLDHISIWGEEAVQSQPRSNHRHSDTYRKISRCMTERGPDRDTLQCRVKVKELRNAYHKALEANRHSGAAPTSCWFYKELDVILSGDPTSTAKATVDTLVARVPVESGPRQEEEILDEDAEGEGDPEAEDDLEVRDVCSQELFSTQEDWRQASHSCWSLAKRKQEKRPLVSGFDFGNC
ncbi:uncharacterized protein RBU57_009617 [Macrochelys suwanniensis]